MRELAPGSREASASGADRQDVGQVGGSMLGSAAASLGAGLLQRKLARRRREAIPVVSPVAEPAINGAIGGAPAAQAPVAGAQPAVDGAQPADGDEAEQGADSGGGAAVADDATFAPDGLESEPLADEQEPPVPGMDEDAAPTAGAPKAAASVLPAHVDAAQAAHATTSGPQATEGGETPGVARAPRDIGKTHAPGLAQPTPTAVRRTAANAPAEGTLIPFDRNPLSAAGERILFNDTFTDASPGDWELHFTGVGGRFERRAGPATRTIAGLDSGNLSFFINRRWNGTTPVTVKLEVRKAADHSVVSTHDWTFAKKPFFPKKMKQTETEGRRPLPSTYEYKILPDRHHGDGTDSYEHQTILERFKANTSNIRPKDLKRAYRNAHGLHTDRAVVLHFFGDSGSNGTFTVAPGDNIWDQHGGGMPDLAQFQAALKTMKEVHVDLPQIYEAKPGRALGRYRIRRILKTDGTKQLIKKKV